MIFFGTSKFSTDILDRLKELGITPSHVVTVPDRPQGRKMLITPPPLKVWAEANNIPCLQFEKLRPYTPESFDSDNPTDMVNPVAVLTDIVNKLPAREQLFLVASYGKIIPQAVLDIPALGALNVHPSLLPKYRGASPLQSTLLANEQELAVCIIKMDAEMDHGPIAAIEYLTPGEGALLNWPLRFHEYETVTARIGADLIAKILPSIRTGTHEYTIQDHSKATFTKKITKEEGHISELTEIAKESAAKLKNQAELSVLRGAQGLLTYLKFCALEDWPGLYFFIQHEGKNFRIKITDMNWSRAERFAEITRVIPEGKKEMGWKDLMNFL